MLGGMRRLIRFSDEISFARASTPHKPDLTPAMIKSPPARGTRAQSVNEEAGLLRSLGRAGMRGLVWGVAFELGTRLVSALFGAENEAQTYPSDALDRR